MNKYKVWLHIEEIDEDKNHYESLDDHTMQVGIAFTDQEDAIALQERLADLVTDDGEVVWVPELSNKSETKQSKIPWIDICPECGANLTNQSWSGVNCQNPECNYWFCY